MCKLPADIHDEDKLFKEKESIIKFCVAIATYKLTSSYQYVLAECFNYLTLVL